MNELYSMCCKPLILFKTKHFLGQHGVIVSRETALTVKKFVLNYQPADVSLNKAINKC